MHGEHEADVDMLSEFDELNASNKQFYERLDCEQKGFLGSVCGRISWLGEISRCAV